MAVLTAKTQYNLNNAREYFEEHLCVGDYYDEGQGVSGEWLGLGAQRLGLAGQVRADDFLRLCENQHPVTGETLTQRLNTTRADADGSVANRRIFYDFTFSPPKSVSLAGFLGEDARVLEAHARAVKSAVREFEAFSAARIRAGGAHSDRRTGNFAAALFTHDTSRALDPHLHTHCIVFNATFDAAEHRWKALQNYDLLRARKFAENAYYHELARELRGFGYRIRNLPRGDFQIEGISTELCDRFSKRDAEIDKALETLLADKPELAGSNIAELRARLATEKRTRKQKDLSRDQLRALWAAQLSLADREALRGLTKSASDDGKQRATVSVVESVQWAEEPDLTIAHHSNSAHICKRWGFIRSGHRDNFAHAADGVLVLIAASLIECALLISLVAIVALVAVRGVGVKVGKSLVTADQTLMEASALLVDSNLETQCAQQD